MRRHPRTVVEVEAVAIIGEESLDVRIKNISKSGIQIETSDELLGQLFPDDRRPSRRQAAGLKVCISGAESLFVECQVVYSRRLAQKIYVFGCEFVGGPESDDANKFVEQVMAGRSS